VKSRARVLGLRRGKEFDAARWGERLRVRTVGGWVVGEGVVQAGGLGEWPEERWFRVYKERRFSRVGAVTKGLRVASTFGAEPTIWGASKLRNVEVVEDEGVKGEVLGKRRRDEEEEEEANMPRKKLKTWVTCGCGRLVRLGTECSSRDCR
jgi:hypothetical protein